MVQTWAVKQITGYFSSEFNTEIKIGGVDIELFKKIVLEEVYVQDLHGDTLLHAPALKLDFADFNYKLKKIRIKSIILEQTTAKIIRYKNEEDYNYSFLIDAFSSPKKDATQSASWDIKFEAINLSDLIFVYRDEHHIGEISGVNYWDLKTTNTNAQIENIYFNQDTIYAYIKHLSAKEKSGFELHSFSCYASVSPVLTKLDSLKINSGKTSIATNLRFNYSCYDDYNDFIDKVVLQASFDHSHVNMADIAYFAPELKGADNTLLLSGNIKGKIDNLKGNNVLIEFGKASSFKGNFNFKGLPDINHTYIVLDVEKITANKADIETLPVPPFTSKEKIKLPSNIALLGNVNFKGNFTGFLEDFVAYGTLTTAIGTIQSDISMVSDTNLSQKIRYKGKIKSYDFDIGKYLYLEKQLGKISIDATVEGAGLNRDNIAAIINGKVSSITFNNYTYQNIDVEGELSKKIFEGKLRVDDPNVKLDFSGDINFADKLPLLTYSADISKANLAALKIISYDSVSVISGKMNLNVKGLNPDDAIGSVKLIDVSYRDSEGDYKMQNFDLKISENADARQIKLLSDFADIDVSGKYVIENLPASIQNVIAHYLPSLIMTDNKRNIANNQQLSFFITCKNMNDFTRLFLPGITISSGTKLTGEYDSEIKRLKIQGNAKEITLSGTVFNELELIIDNKDTELFAKVGCNKIKLSDSLSVFNPSFYAITNSTINSINSDFNWHQNSNGDKKSFLSLVTKIENQNQTFTQIKSSEIYIEDSLWALKNGDNSLLQDTSSIKIGLVTFGCGKQEIKLYGTASNNKDDKISLGLSNFSLTNINPFISSSGVQLNGTVSGETSVIDFYDRFLLTSNLLFKKLIFNNELIGSGNVNSRWDKENEGISMDGSLARDSITSNLKFKGIYYPSKKENSLDFKIDLYAVRLQLFKEYVKDYCSIFTGQLAGGITLQGTPQKPILDGKLSVNAKNIFVDYLNTAFAFDGDIYVDNNSFGVRDLHVRDSKDVEERKKIGAGTAIVTGKLYHDNFKNFQLDFDMKADKLQCLNTTETQNELYYGKANVSGIANFFGYLNNIVIDANLKTEKGTQFNIPFTSTEEVSETGFVTFVKKQKDTTTVEKKYKVDLSGMRLNFDLEVTPAAQVQLIFDSKIGDIISGRGNGNIKMGISTLGDFNMFGEFVITEGDYLFTLKNVINKRFDIESGSTVKWTGDPYEATANITAAYRQRASIHPFFPNDSSAAYKKRYPVDCMLKLSDKLMTPIITFDIELPTLEDNIRQQIKSYLSTEQEMNRQVFSLLILKSFVTPPQLAGIASAESGATGAGVANSTELLSNQLSNWLSQISNDFDVGVNYRPGDNLSSDELEVALSTQIFNDRVTIDGNLGVTNSAGANQQNTSNLAGDVNIEYKITDDGKLRLRGFNKANDNTLLASTTAPYTQGVGIFYREDFNTLKELYGRYMKKLGVGKKTETPKN